MEKMNEQPQSAPEKIVSGLLLLHGKVQFYSCKRRLFQLVMKLWIKTDMMVLKVR